MTTLEETKAKTAASLRKLLDEIESHTSRLEEMVTATQKAINEEVKNALNNKSYLPESAPVTVTTPPAELLTSTSSASSKDSNDGPVPG